MPQGCFLVWLLLTAILGDRCYPQLSDKNRGIESQSQWGGQGQRPTLGDSTVCCPSTALQPWLQRTWGRPIWKMQLSDGPGLDGPGVVAVEQMSTKVELWSRCPVAQT